MDEKTRERIALFRFSVIGSLISGELCRGDLKRRIRDLSQRRYSMPHSNRSRIAYGTIEDWLYAYRAKGIDGLKPKARSDSGSVRRLAHEVADAIISRKQEAPRLPVKAIVRELVAQNKLRPYQVALSTVYRYMALKLPRAAATTTGKEQKRFTHRYPNDCWQSDCMHGPYLKDPDDAKAKKTYLIAFLDDATRLIVGAEFFFSEATVNIKAVLREAVVTYGIPSKLYLDNGRNFCADDLQLACAVMKCALIHTTPYYPEAKGKIERFFRTVRDGFLAGLRPVSSLDVLNQTFHAWLHDQYNRAPHRGIEGKTPLDTFLANAENHIRRLPAHIDPAELFCRKESRLVAKDGTFRVNNVLYETEEHLIGRRIEVLYDRDDASRKVKVFDGPLLVHTAHPVDFLGNAHAKRKDLNPSIKLGDHPSERK
jgi:transposase InsO family protein